MDLPEEWKSLFPTSGVFRPPLLLSGSSTRPILGPLVFNPNVNTINHLFSSSSLLPAPCLLPHLSLPRFLLTSSSVPPSTSSSVASLFDPHHHNEADSHFLNNRLEFLHCLGTNCLILFFPTGENSDQVGFLLICARNSRLDVQIGGNGDVYATGCKFKNQILRISANPVANSDSEFCTSRGDSSSAVVGYLLATTMYSVQWFIVKIKDISGSGEVEMPTVAYVGCKIFKSCAVVHACWSSHIPEESLVLLESGALFLFDLKNDWLKTNCPGKTYFKGIRLKVPWDNFGDIGNFKWLSCEFSWHPRILIVARCDAIFLVDLRFDECKVTCLLKIQTLYMYTSIDNEWFVALSKVGSDGFHFAIASNSLLLLCDVRKPLIPLLQWTHHLAKPCYINVFRLSDLRAHSTCDTYNWASESGFCIILGSFRDSEFNIFCYGPSLPTPAGSVASKIAELNKYFYAWDIPSDIILSGSECQCGNCLVKEEFLKDSLPEWIRWQHKKEIVLGFGILNKDLSALLNEPDEFGGFTLIRLMSSGRLESQKFYASWTSINTLKESHDNHSRFNDYLLCSVVDEEYKFAKRFTYLELDCLHGYLQGNLDKVIVSKMKNPPNSSKAKESFDPEFHEVLCEKLNSCGFGALRSSPAVTVAFNDISLPTSIYEVAVRRLWSDLPMEILQLSFSNYLELFEVLVNRKRVESLEFMVVPDLAQLPPFFLRKPSCRSNKWSTKILRSHALVGPALPLPILLTLHEFRGGCPSLEEESSGFALGAEIGTKVDEIIQVARELATPNSVSDLDGNCAVSLADDREETWEGSQKPKPFLLHHPTALNCASMDHSEGKSVYGNDTFGTLISKVSEDKHATSGNVETVGLELFDHLCPIQLKFDDTCSIKFGEKELTAYKLLKKQFSKWQGDFHLYKEFSSRSMV